MFGFGSLWSGSGQAEPAAAKSPVGIKSSNHAAAQPGVAVNEVQAEIPSNPAVRTGEPAQAHTNVADKNADKYFCGALTKKGTPCSRKVKTKGQRCFQHEGKPEAPTSE